MPIYEFKCSKCGEEFEDLVPMSDPRTTCPSCGARRVEKLVPSTVGIVFKGSGFYVTDNNKHTPSGNGGNGSKDATKDSGEDKKETDSKPSSDSSTDKPEADKTTTPSSK
jgi:putative FmdB family regulatory protein